MEGNNKNKPRVLMLFGAPCSGKTTFGEKFAKKFHLAHFDLGELMAANNFTRKNMLVILEQLLKTGQTILVEGGVETEQDRIEMRNLIRSHGYEPSLIWIQTDVATIRNRLKNKFHSVKKAKDFYETALAKLEAPSENERVIILSGKHTFETQMRHVLSGLAESSSEK